MGKKFSRGTAEQMISAFENKLVELGGGAPVKSSAEVRASENIYASKAVDDEIDQLFHKYVPGQGKADTLVGEIIRAICRIGYRWYNDGDMIGTGYGNETCNAPARFLAEKCGGRIAERIESIWGLGEYEDGKYRQMLEALEIEVLNYVKNNLKSLEVPNTEDMWDWYEEEDGRWEEPEDYGEDDYYDDGYGEDYDIESSTKVQAGAGTPVEYRVYEGVDFGDEEEMECVEVFDTEDEAIDHAQMLSEMNGSHTQVVECIDEDTECIWDSDDDPRFSNPDLKASTSVNSSEEIEATTGTSQEMLNAFQEKLAELNGVDASTKVRAASGATGSRREYLDYLNAVVSAIHQNLEEQGFQHSVYYDNKGLKNLFIDLIRPDGEPYTYVWPLSDLGNGEVTQKMWDDLEEDADTLCTLAVGEAAGEYLDDHEESVDSSCNSCNVGTRPEPIEGAQVDDREVYPGETFAGECLLSDEEILYILHRLKDDGFDVEDEDEFLMGMGADLGYEEDEAWSILYAIEERGLMDEFKATYGDDIMSSQNGVDDRDDFIQNIVDGLLEGGYDVHDESQVLSGLKELFGYTDEECQDIISSLRDRDSIQASNDSALKSLDETINELMEAGYDVKDYNSVYEGLTEYLGYEDEKATRVASRVVNKIVGSCNDGKEKVTAEEDEEVDATTRYILQLVNEIREAVDEADTINSDTYDDHAVIRVVASNQIIELTVPFEDLTMNEDTIEEDVEMLVKEIRSSLKSSEEE